MLAALQDNGAYDHVSLQDDMFCSCQECVLFRNAFISPIMKVAQDEQKGEHSFNMELLPYKSRIQHRKVDGSLVSVGGLDQNWCRCVVDQIFLLKSCLGRGFHTMVFNFSYWVGHYQEIETNRGIMLHSAHRTVVSKPVFSY